MARRRNQPNLFEFGGGGATITWTTAGFTGQPQLTYDDGEQQATFGPEQLRRSRSPLGRLITAYLEVVPDSHTTTLVLVVPDVVLGDRQEQRVRTVAIVSRLEMPFAPQVATGQLQTYKVLRLSGTARQVEF